MNLSDYPHRRQNILTGEWVLVSPHRAKRPWQGKVEDPVTPDTTTYDPQCYLCPGNTRAGGVKNPDYTTTYVFTNDFAALLEDTPGERLDDGLFIAGSERGICRVICFSPRHDLTLALMDKKDIATVVDIWTSQFEELRRVDFINHIQIFENRGAIMGCSNPHPHGQIWANETIPMYPSRENERQKNYFDKNGSPLLIDYVNKELANGERIIFANDSFVALCPFWAVWPFETMILPRDPAPSLLSLDAHRQADLADALNRMAVRFDNLFSTSFPYSMGVHQMPVDGGDYPWWQFHIHYYPPLLRSATVKKFMVGYEMLGMPQRDITPEESARRLRDDCSERHYSLG